MDRNLGSISVDCVDDGKNHDIYCVEMIRKFKAREALKFVEND
jgi:hypothetical protein